MKIGVIGGGMMGLQIAYRLTKSGHKVHVIEAMDQVGGLATWLDYGDFIWDKYYHVILTSDTHLLGLIEELGLTDEVVWKQTKTGFLWKGQLVSMSSYKEFFTFPVLSFIQKIRFAAGLLYCRTIRNSAFLEKITAKQWLTRVFGKTIYQRIWEPLLRSKFGSLKEEIPATIIWATITRYSSTRSKGKGEEWMGHLRSSGLKALFDAMTEAIGRQGGMIHCSCAVQSIEENDTEGVIVKANGKAFQFDRLISTLPTQLIRRIAPQLQWGAVNPNAPRFLGVIRLALLLKSSMSPYYVTNILDPGYSFTGIIEVSRLTEPGEMRGHHLVMIPKYDVPDSDWFQKSDEKIREQLMQELRTLWPDLDKTVIRSFVHREKIVQALWLEGPPMLHEAPHTLSGKIWSVNAELAGRDTLNNNAIIRVADQECKRFEQELTQ